MSLELYYDGTFYYRYFEEDIKREKKSVRDFIGSGCIIRNY